MLRQTESFKRYRLPTNISASIVKVFSFLKSISVLSKTDHQEDQIVDAQEPVSANLISGFDVWKVKFYFSHQLYTGEYLVEVREWNSDEIKHISSLDFKDENVLVLEPYSAHYTVYGLFTDDGSIVYEMEYRFDVKMPE